MLEQALAMSMGGGSSGVARAAGRVEPDFNNMSEEEQIAYAMQMSMADSGSKYFDYFLVMSYDLCNCVLIINYHFICSDSNSQV